MLTRTKRVDLYMISSFNSMDKRFEYKNTSNFKFIHLWPQGLQMDFALMLVN